MKERITTVLGQLGGLFDSVGSEMFDTISFTAFKFDDTSLLNVVTSASYFPTVGTKVGDWVYSIHGDTWTNLCYKFNIKTKEAVKLNNAAVKRSDAKAVLYNNRYIFIAGGEDTHYNPTPLDTLYRYDTTNDTWSKRANMPFTSNAADPVLIGNKLYVFRGTSVTNAIYDISANTWSTFSITIGSGSKTSYTLTGSAIYYDNADTVYFFKNKIWVKLALSTMTITELSYDTAESVSVSSTSARYFIRKIDDNRLAYIASNTMYIIDLSELTCKKTLSQYFNPICDYDDKSILCWYVSNSEDKQQYNSLSILKYK